MKDKDKLIDLLEEMMFSAIIHQGMDKEQIVNYADTIIRMINEG